MNSRITEVHVDEQPVLSDKPAPSSVPMQVLSATLMGLGWVVD